MKRTPALRLRRASEGGREQCPGIQVKEVFQEGVRLMSQHLRFSTALTSARAFLMGWWECSPDLIEQRGEGAERHIDSPSGGFAIKGSREIGGSWRGCGVGNQGRVLFFLASIRDLPACFKLLFALLLCETLKEISPILNSLEPLLWKAFSFRILHSVLFSLIIVTGLKRETQGAVSPLLSTSHWVCGFITAQQWRFKYHHNPCTWFR